MSLYLNLFSLNFFEDLGRLFQVFLRLLTLLLNLSSNFLALALDIIDFSSLLLNGFFLLL